MNTPSFLNMLVSVSELGELEPIRLIGFSALQMWWAGIVVAGWLALSLRLARNAAPHFRYSLGIAALAMLLIAPCWTTAASWNRSSWGTSSSLSHVRLDASRDISSPSEPNGVDRGRRSAPVGTEIESKSRFLDRAGFSPTVTLPSQMYGAMQRLARPASFWVGAFWIAGVLVIALRRVRSWRLVRKIRITAQPLTEPRWSEMSLRAAHAVGLANTLPIASARVPVPMLAGWLRPVVLLPRDSLTRLSVEEIEWMVRHELVHFKRADGWINLVQVLVESILFFHPVSSYVSRVLRRERELCCDDVVSRCGEGREYARALFAVESLRPANSAFASTVHATGGKLEQRIARIVDPQPARSGHPVAAVVIGMIGISLLGLDARPGSAGNGITNESSVGEAADSISFEEWLTLAEQAIASGDDLAAVDLLPARPAMDFKQVSMQRYTAASFALTEAWHRRYDEVFTPPSNIELLIPNFQWRESSVGMSFNANGVGSSSGGSEEAWFSNLGNRDTTWLAIHYAEEFELAADLELDGRPDVLYDGSTVDVKGDYEVVADQADSRRSQWLVSKRGEDPRRTPRLFLYRDGETLLILMYTDGDGQGDLGRSNSTRRR